MKKVILISVLHCLIFSLNAQKVELPYKVNKHTSIVMINDLYGIQYDGKIKIPAIYDNYDTYGEMITLWKVTKENEVETWVVGMANSNGDLVIPVEYNSLDEADAVVGIFIASKDNKYGAIDSEGKILVPVEFERVDCFESSILAVGDGKYALYKTDGSVVFPPQEKEIRVLDDYGQDYAIKEYQKYIVNIPEDKEILKGYVRISNRLFAKNTEVSIRDYFAFVADQRVTSLLVDKVTYTEIPYTDLLPDTNLVEKKLIEVYQNFFTELAKEEGYDFVEYNLVKDKKQKYAIDIPIENYKELNKMMNFPITGISHRQATLYTEWLTTVYADFFYDNDYEYKVSYRLPTEKEWSDLAISGLSESMRPNLVLDSVNAENCMLFIHDNLIKCKTYDSYVSNSLGGGSVPVLSMNPDWNGVYQLFGNVAEMTSSPEINKGGSFKHNAKLAATQNVQSADGPQPWLGFRVVAEMVID